MTSKTDAKKRGRPKLAEKGASEPPPSDATIGFEAKLWQAADKLRNNMDAAEYKHVVLGLIFLKYISDAFEEKHGELEADKKSGADPEDPDEYRAENIFWVPKAARWSFLQGKATQPTIGKLLDDAMVAIERDNPTLKGVLPKDYGRPALDKTRTKTECRQALLRELPESPPCRRLPPGKSLPASPRWQAVLREYPRSPRPNSARGAGFRRSSARHPTAAACANPHRPGCAGGALPRGC